MELPEQPNVRPLDYAQPEKPPSRARLFMGIALGCGVLLLWGLFEVQRMPYRPPEDMSTLLGGVETVVVRLMMGIIGVFWVVGLLWFINSWRRK